MLPHVVRATRTPPRRAESARREASLTLCRLARRYLTRAPQGRWYSPDRPDPRPIWSISQRSSGPTRKPRLARGRWLPSAARWTFVVSPPRDRPMARPSCSPAGAPCAGSCSVVVGSRDRGVHRDYPVQLLVGARSDQQRGEHSLPGAVSGSHPQPVGDARPVAGLLRQLHPLRVSQRHPDKRADAPEGATARDRCHWPCRQLSTRTSVKQPSLPALTAAGKTEVILQLVPQERADLCLADTAPEPLEERGKYAVVLVLHLVSDPDRIPIVEQTPASLTLTLIRTKPPG